MNTDNTIKEKLYALGYRPLTSGVLSSLKPFYSLRPIKSCAGAPLCSCVYRYFYEPYYLRLDDALLTVFIDPGPGNSTVYRENDADGTASIDIGRTAGYPDFSGLYGFPPYCTADRVPGYFRLQERQFNSSLGLPLRMLGADEEFVGLMEAAGALSGYDVREVQNARDYLYSAESLRSLAGRRYCKKRNHIHKFLSICDGKWSYRRLSPHDAGEALTFLDSWMLQREADSNANGLDLNGNSFNPVTELDAEYRGIRDILSDPCMYGYAKTGGIFIEGKLKAFSIGDYNPAGRIALISVEKADGTIPGLYQMINREFLTHEYPDALLVNREDDVGMEGLRRSKLSYHPVAYEHKYALTQKLHAV